MLTAVVVHGVRNGPGTLEHLGCREPLLVEALRNASVSNILPLRGYSYLVVTAASLGIRKGVSMHTVLVNGGHLQV